MAIFLLIITVQRGILIDIWNRISLFNIRSNSYEREAPIDLSPAVLSYIINGRIESNKDIVATILNLSAKGYIKLRKDQEELVVEKRNFIHNNTVINTSEELRPDEKYIYEWLTQNNGQNYNINNWYKIIKDEAEKTKYIRGAETYITYILLAISAVVGTISYTHRFKFGIENIIAYLSLLLALPACIYEDSRKSGKVGRKFYTYTKEGKLFLKKVSGFKKYIKDFSIIKNRELEEVYLWEEYLAYSMVLNINRKYYKKTIKQLGKYTDIDLDTKILTI
jgi:uncharacterized membrane protein